MCLLKRDEHDTNCGHEECRNYYMLNKQMCAYNISTQNPNFTPNPFLNQQTPKGPIYSQPNMMNSNTTNVKRSLKPEQEGLGFIKKKVKTEGTNICILSYNVFRRIKRS